MASENETKPRYTRLGDEIWDELTRIAGERTAATRERVNLSDLIEEACWLLIEREKKRAARRVG